MIQVRDNRGNYHEALAIYDNAGREIKEVRNNQGRLLFKNWNEIQGSPPITFRGYGKNLTECRIYGNTAQNGTPTPENPVEVKGCGERTENLFDIDGEVFAAYNNVDVVDKKIYCSDIGQGANSRIIFSKYYPAGTYTIKVSSDGDVSGIRFLSPEQFNNGTYNNVYKGYFRALINEIITVTFDESFRAGFVFLGDGGEGHIQDIQITPGSTPPDHYIPYGYKLPLTVNGTEHPIYLGQVETTRRIKKLVLTGEETAWHFSNGFVYNDDIQPDYLRSTKITLMCSHYRALGGVGEGAGVQNGGCAFYRYPSIQRLYIRDNNYTTLDDFKSYLAAQYTAGTPVTVWYVPTEPETAIVNEPIQKIGDYSDELSIADIPTINGINTISADTTVQVQPSEMYIKGKIKSIT